MRAAMRTCGGNTQTPWNHGIALTFNGGLLTTKRNSGMDKEHVKGAAQKAKGAVKDAAGALTDDKKLQAEGKTDKAAGAARQSAGDIKDAGRKVVDSLKR